MSLVVNVSDPQPQQVPFSTIPQGAPFVVGDDVVFLKIAAQPGGANCVYLESAASGPVAGQLQAIAPDSPVTPAEGTLNLVRRFA